MSTGGQSADQAVNLLQNLSLDSQTKDMEFPEATNKASAANLHINVDSGDAANGHFQPYERSMTPLLQDFMEPAVYYVPNGFPASPGYYYGGYEGSGTESDDFRYFNQGVQIPHGLYGDNGSPMYQHAYGYVPYGPYSPAGSHVPTLGYDDQLYGSQHYQYPTPYFQPLSSNNGPSHPGPTVISKIETPTSVPAEVAQIPVTAANGSANDGFLKGSNGSAFIKSTHQNLPFNSNGPYGRGSLLHGAPLSGYQPWFDANSTLPLSRSNSIGNSTSSRNQNFRPHSLMLSWNEPRHLAGIGTANGYMNRVFPNKFPDQFGNIFRSGYGYDLPTNGRSWSSVDNKYKARGRSYGNEHTDVLNELNRGPRAKGPKNQKEAESNEVLTAEREQYNSSDFLEKYNDAKFFVIKSYSEDDVHKSIKYNVWASTPNGNKKLDAAYQEALEKPNGCPVFLFFSVNTSGQFVGVAEMVGPVDFHKSLEYWQQDKWNGCFQVKWHILKDLPNNLLKHITLENNENKPVTNSRDTQEVKLEQGLQVVKIFKDFAAKTCILDDFEFYEGRQKTIQEKKARQQQLSKQVWEGKPSDERNKEGPNEELKSLNTTQVSCVSIKDSATDNQINWVVKRLSESSVNMEKTIISDVAESNDC